MASGSFMGNSPVNTNLYVTWSSTPNTTANTSSVTVNMYMRHYRMYATAVSGSYLSVGGNSSNYSKSISYSGSSQTDTLLTSKTVTVSHNADGSGTCNITGTFILNGTLSGTYVGTITASQTVTLDKIARSSSIDKITNTSGTVISSIDTGQSVRVYWTPATSSYKYRLQFAVSGSTYTFPSTTTYYTPGTTSQYYATVATAHSWVPSKPSDNVSVMLHTYDSNGNFISDTKYSAFALNVPQNIKPTISSFNLTVVDGKGTNPVYVLGKSKVKLTVFAAKGDGASNISSYTFNGPYVDGQNSSVTKYSTGTGYEITSGILNYSGTLKYSVTVTDTRGRSTTSAEKSIVVQPYAAPFISSLTVQRCNSSGNLDENGTYAYVTVTSSYSTLNGNNTRTVVLSSSIDNYSAKTTIQATTNTSNTYSGTYGGSFSIGSVYTIRATITDTAYQSTSSKDATITTAERPINFAQYGNGISIGGMSSVSSKSSDGLFEVNWDTNINKNIYMGGRNGQTDEQQIVFSNPTNSANPHNCCLYGGNPSSATDIGIWDNFKNQAVIQYASSINNGTMYFQVPTTSVEISYNSNSDNNETALNTWLSARFGTMGDLSCTPCRITCYPAISGTTVCGFLYRASSGYGYFSGQDYFGLTVYKSLQNGVWQNVKLYTMDSITARISALENRHLNEFASIAGTDLPNTPPGYSGYARQLRFGAPNSSDKYYLMVDSNGKLFTGAQLNNAKTITWYEK